MQMNSLHSSCCLLRHFFLWSRHHFKDFIAVMVSQRNPTAQFLPRDGETCRRQKPVRFCWITARVCLIKHEAHNDRTVCGWVIFLLGRVHWLIVGSAENTALQEGNLMARLLSSAFATYLNHSPIRLKWRNYIIIKDILNPFIGCSSMWPT